MLYDGLYLWLLLLSNLLVRSWGICIWDTWLNHFWVIDQLHLDYFPVALMGLKCLLWSWWCRVVTYLTWPFWILRSILFLDTFWLVIENWWVLWFTLRYFLLVHWEPMDIVIYHWCLQLLIENYCDYYDYHLMLFSFSWRIDVIIVDYILVLSIYLYRTKVIMWFLISWA